MGLWATIPYAKGLAEYHSVLPKPYQEGVVALFVLPKKAVHFGFIPVGIEPPEVVFELPLPQELHIPG